MTGDVRVRDHRPLLHRLVESVLPWYSADEERERDARTEAIRRDAIEARMKAEQVREAYRRAAAKVER